MDSPLPIAQVNPDFGAVGAFPVIENVNATSLAWSGGALGEYAWRG